MPRAETVAVVSGFGQTTDAAGMAGSSQTVDREQLARTLMEYARANPDRISGRLMPVIVYDPRAGHRAFRVMMEKVAMANPSRTNPPSP